MNKPLLPTDRVLIKTMDITALVVQESYTGKDFYILVDTTGRLQGEMADNVFLISRKAKKLGASS